MTHAPISPAALDEIIAVARAHGVNPMGCMPHRREPEGHLAKSLGWRPKHVAQVETCRRFLRAPDRPHYSRGQSSDFLTQEVERWSNAAKARSSIANGSILVACWLEGLKPRRIHTWPPSANAKVVLPKRVTAPKRSSGARKSP